MADMSHWLVGRAAFCGILCGILRRKRCNMPIGSGVNTARLFNVFIVRRFAPRINLYQDHSRARVERRRRTWSYFLLAETMLYVPNKRRLEIFEIVLCSSSMSFAYQGRKSQILSSLCSLQERQKVTKKTNQRINTGDCDLYNVL